MNKPNTHNNMISGMLPGALTHKYAWHLNGVVLCGHVTNKIHKYLHLQKMYGHQTRQGVDLV